MIALAHVVHKLSVTTNASHLLNVNVKIKRGFRSTQNSHPFKNNNTNLNSAKKSYTVQIEINSMKTK